MDSSPPPPEQALTRAEKWSAALLLLIVIGLLIGDLAMDFEPAKWSAVFILLAWFPLLFIHELGHALMAAAVGWRVRRYVIGFGRVWAHFWVRETEVELRLVAVEGFVEPRPRNLRFVRVKNCLIYAAGPGIELLVVGLIAWIVGWDLLLQRTDALGMIAIQSVAVAAAAGAVLNLVPHPVSTERGFTANDGLGMIQSFFIPRSDYEERLWPAGDSESPQSKRAKELGDEDHKPAFVGHHTLERPDEPPN